MAEHLQQNVAENEHEIQPTHDVHIEYVLHNERMAIKRSQTMPRWLKQTLQDSKLSGPLLGKTRSSSRHASSNFVDYSIVAIACNEEPLTFEDACADPHWMSAMQLEMDSIHKNGTWEYVNFQKERMSLVLSGFTRLNESPMVVLIATKLDWLPKDMHNNMALIMRKLLHLLHA